MYREDIKTKKVAIMFQTRDRVHVSASALVRVSLQASQWCSHSETAYHMHALFDRSKIEETEYHTINAF